MAKYIDIATDLRERIRSGEHAVGSKLPGISTLQEVYGVPGLNTIRAAQRILIGEGLLRPEQGVGTFVVRVPAAESESADALAELRVAREALDKAIRALESA
jgi:DNA-binding GntR family transcriptional regulator